MTLLLGEIAARFGLELRGDAATPISGVGTLEAAGPGQIGFLANPRYRKQLAETQASAVVLSAADAAHAPGAVLVSRNPYADFARIGTLFERREKPLAGVHASAVIDPSAMVAATASIGPCVVIGPRARVEDGAEIGPHCLIGEDCVVGADCRLVARVSLVIRVTLGARVLIHPGAVIGADGFGLAMDRGHWLNVRLDNQIQIGHNVRIGAHTAMAGCSAVAGSARIGRYCLIGGGAGVVGHLEIADKVTITAMSLVTHSIREAGEYSSGTPLMNNRDWRRAAVRFKQLDRLARQHSPGSEVSHDD